MNKIDNKVIYNLLSSIDILIYLNINDKKEFSTCCKTIYYKCTRIRLKNLKFGPLELVLYIRDNQQEKSWGGDSYELNLEYFDTIINNYKYRILNLIYIGPDYFIIDYFSQIFSNLSSLSLECLSIPKTILRDIINNLPNLRSLYLHRITVVNSKIDPQVTDFNFSKYLKKLRWVDCRQFELDSTDYLSMKQYANSLIRGSDIMLVIPLYLVNTLKYLEWRLLVPDDIQIFNMIIFNNPELISIKVTLDTLNSDSFKHISNNPNLTKLSILLCVTLGTFNRPQPSKLFNIKTLELDYNLQDCFHLFDVIVENCPKCEKLKLQYSIGCDDYFIQYIKKLKKLKVLSIYDIKYTPNIFDSVLPESNLEQLIIESTCPLSLKFNNFTNLKNLNCIKNIHKPYKKLLKEEIPNYEELKDWRIISHYSSTHYWKV